jgi:integrase
VIQNGDPPSGVSVPKAPTYLWRNRHGVFYFRFVIPPALRYAFNGQRELRKTLSTPYRKEAIALARALMVEVEQTIRSLMKVPDLSNGDVIQIISMKNVVLGPDRSVESIVIEAPTPEQEAQMAQQLLHPPHSHLRLVEPISEPGNSTSTMLSEVIAEYCSEHTALGKWTQKTEGEMRSSFKLLAQITGDVPFRSLKHPELRKYKQALLKLPPNMNKVKRYRDKSVQEILAMDNVKAMAPNTINQHVSLTSSLFKWAQKHGYTDLNYAEGLGIGKDKKPSEERDIFKIDELKLLFESQEYRDGFEEAYRYWVPLIGLYSGARLEEICQLYIEDIRLDGEIYFFDINDNHDKKVKNKNATRKVPIHPKLIELGFIEYVRNLKLASEQRVFPELKRARDGYGQIPSKWFARYRERCGITEKGKVFHSFRHTFIDHLKQKSIAIDKIAALVGHEDQSMTSGRYGKQYSINFLLDVIKYIDFDLLLIPYAKCEF